MSAHGETGEQGAEAPRPIGGTSATVAVAIDPPLLSGAGQEERR